MTTKEIYDNPEKYNQMTTAASKRVLDFIFDDEEMMKMTPREIKHTLDLARDAISNIVTSTLERTSFEEFKEMANGYFHSISQKANDLEEIERQQQEIERQQQEIKQQQKEILARIEAIEAKRQARYGENSREGQ